MKKKKKLTTVYTDGSCLPSENGGYCAYITDTKTTLCGAFTNTTNNKMELEAIIKVLEYTEGDIKIYTDSMYAIQSATVWLDTWKNNNWKTKDKKDVKNKEEIMKLDKLLQDRKVTFEHVRAHRGNKYNEYCDEISRNEAKSIP